MESLAARAQENATHKARVDAFPQEMEEALKKADGQQRDRLAALLRTKDAPES